MTITSPLFRRFPRILVCLGILSAGIASLSAQENASSRLAANAASREQFARGNFQAGESLLHAAARQKTGTAEWHLEMAGRLMRFAFDFAQSGEPTTAATLGRRALAQLASAQATTDSAREPHRLANIMEQAAVIHEYLLGDATAARKHYAEAERLAPGKGQAAEKLSLLERQDAHSAALQQDKKG